MKLNILKDRFLIGASIVIIIMILFFIFAIRTYWLKIESKRELLRKQKATLEMIEKTGSANPTDPKIKAYLDYKQKLEQEYQKSIEFYKEIDKSIEKWFDVVILDRNGNPTEDSFVAAYNNARNKLIGDSLTDRKISVVNDNGDEVSDVAQKTEVLGFAAATDKVQYKEIQKRFWIQKKLIEALGSSGLEVQKCGTLKVKGTTEAVKMPDNLGVMIPFEVTVYLPYKNIERLFSYITDNSKGGPFLVVQQTKIIRASKQGEGIKEVTMLIQEKEQWKPSQDVPLVKVVISGSAVDFEMP